MEAKERFQLYQELDGVMREASRELHRTPLELRCIHYVACRDEQTTTQDIFKEFSSYGPSRISTLGSDLVRAGVFRKQINMDGPQNKKIVSLTAKGKAEHEKLMCYFEEKKDDAAKQNHANSQ
jgi:DNA-binding MarR family transcriptional regulator